MVNKLRLALLEATVVVLVDFVMLLLLLLALVSWPCLLILITLYLVVVNESYS